MRFTPYFTVFLCVMAIFVAYFIYKYQFFGRQQTTASQPPQEQDVVAEKPKTPPTTPPTTTTKVPAQVYNYYAGDTYPIPPTASQNPLPDKTLFAALMKPTSITRAPDGNYIIDSAQPHDFGVLETDKIVTKKELHIVGTAQYNNTYFTIISGKYTGDIDVCAQCAAINIYYSYNMVNGIPSNISKPMIVSNEGLQSFGDNYLPDYSFMEQKDLNGDGVNELFLHQSHWVEQGDSGYLWKGFTVFEMRSNQLYPIVQIPIGENAEMCGRCGNVDGKFMYYEWRFSDAKKGEYPAIYLTQNTLIKDSQDNQYTKYITSFTANYDPQTHVYIAK